MMAIGMVKPMTRIVRQFLKKSSSTATASTEPSKSERTRSIKAFSISLAWSKV